MTTNEHTEQIEWAQIINDLSVVARNTNDAMAKAVCETAAALLAADKAGWEVVAIVTMSARIVGSEVKTPALELVGELPPVGTKLYTSPQSQHSALPDDVVKDAERYRWLREGDYPFSFAQRILNDTPWGIDAAIDAAMLKEGKV